MSSLKIKAHMRDKVFFTSDQHYGHENVIKFCDRPFRDAQHMNDELVRLHNERVPKDGVVFHLGDFVVGRAKTIFDDVFPRLNGAQHYLIEGNHEKAVLDVPANKARFATVEKYKKIYVEDEDALDGVKQLICMFHYPIHEWDRQHHAAWHLHGHTHNGVKPDFGMKRLDAGVDNPLAGYAPFSYADVKQFMAKCDYTRLDLEKKLGANA